jgi:streptogramin lyase
MRPIPWPSLIALCALSACGGAECVDEDGDGRGEHCERGPDCDDTDPRLAEDCTAAALACLEEPFAEGCACLSGSRRECYEGPEGTRGVSACRPGRRHCWDERWGPCEGQVLPVFELCNGEDDDCDGIADEGVLSPCGGCNADCTGGVWGPPLTPFEAEGELAVTAAGELTLRQHEHEVVSVWVPNTGEGTVSKVDAVSAREVARYRVPGEAPERIAIDHNGDAWVLSPGFESASYLSKIGGEPDRCPDRGGDGPTTSSGPSDVLPLGEDDCLLLQIPVAPPGEVARALAVDGKRAPDRELGGNIWVGLQNGEQILELDGESGELARTIDTPGFAAYAAAFDPWGSLWAIDRAGLLAAVHPGDSEGVVVLEAPLRCYEFESLASDAQGALVLTGFACEDIVVYDPRRDLWSELKTPGVLDTRGLALVGQEIWVSHTGGSVSRVQRDPFEVQGTFALASDGFMPIESIATGADSRGNLWVVSSMGAPGGRGVLTRFEIEREQVTAQVPLGLLPRAPGDITGDRRLPAFAPEASARHVFDGCGVVRADQAEQRVGQPTEWRRLHLAWVGAEGASVDVEARHAERRGALEAVPWLALGTLPSDDLPFDLSFPRGGVVEVRLTLRVANRLGAPRIARVGIEWGCGGPD